MFLDALIARATRVVRPHGYAASVAACTLRLGADGTFVAFDVHATPVPVEIPTLGSLRSSNVLANTGIDTVEYALGLAEDPARRHAAFREQLADVPHPAARAFAVYLATAHRPTLPPTLDPKRIVRVEVDGHPEWWRDVRVVAFHQARLSSRAVRTGGGKEDSACSLCGAWAPLVRIFPKSGPFKATLISFNCPAWQGYGHTDGACAPTCAECATRLMQGFDDVAGSRDTCFRYADGKYVLWWADDATAPGPFPLLRTILDPATTSEDRETALGALADGHVASVEVGQGRIALRRHATVSADGVRERLRAWLACFPPMNAPVFTAAKMIARKDAIDLYYERLFLTLLGGEPVPRRDTALVRARMIRECVPGLAMPFSARVCRAFLLWAGEEPPYREISVTDDATLTFDHRYLPTTAEDTMPPNEQQAFALGRLLVRAEQIQWRNGRTKRPLGTTLFAPLQRHPRHTATYLEPYGRARGRGSDRVFVALRVRAGLLPERFTAGERARFVEGYYFQRDLTFRLRAKFDADAPADEATPTPAKD